MMPRALDRGFQIFGAREGDDPAVDPVEVSYYQRDGGRP